MNQLIANPGGAYANALAGGLQTGQQIQQMTRQNKLAEYAQQYGPALMQGDPEALNVLAQLDPQAAYQMQRQGAADQRGAAQAARQERSMEMDEQRFAMQMEEYAASKDAATRQAEAEQIKQGVFAASAAQSPEQWDQVVTGLGMPELAGQFDQKDMLIRRYMTAAQILEADKGEKPADEYQRYVQEEGAAGRQPLSRIDFAQAKKGKGTIVYDPVTGNPLVSIGGGPDGNGLKPSAPSAMIDTIDGILNDPALDVSTGIMSPLQNIPGTPMKRFQGRANQLNGQAFLQAFESLKGAGQITEIEGAKATQAIGRLDSSQSADDYRSALTELRSILAVATERAPGWAKQARQREAAQELLPADQVKSMSPDEIRSLGPDGLLRLPVAELKGLSDEQWDAIEALAN